jgi:hypothetical protein
MDNLSEYIPLILIVGSIIVSVIKGTGKKRQEEMAKTTLPNKKVREITQPDRKVSPGNFSHKQAKTHSQQSSKPVKEKRDTVAKKFSEKVLSISEETEYEPPILDIEDSSTVKKAFIYSEIWNRKEW